MGSSPRQRLFFALWPDDAFRAALARLSKKVLHKQGKRIAPENLHVTLVFLGPTDPIQRACAEEVAARVAVEPFTLEFDRLGYWPKPQVLWSAPSHVPKPLAALVSSLTRGLTKCGFTPEMRTYQAHLTLARKVTSPVLDAVHEPLPWQVQDFQLVESETRPEGARYRVLRSWPLQDKGPASSLRFPEEGPNTTP